MSSLYIDWEVLYSYNSLHYQVTKTYILTFCLVLKDTLRASQLYILEYYKPSNYIKLLNFYQKYSSILYYRGCKSWPKIHTPKYKVLVFLLL